MISDIRFVKSIIVLLLIVLSGCTAIEITDDEGNLRVEKSFGFSSIIAGESPRAITAKIVSLGYVSTPIGHNFGYSNHEILLSGQDCKIVVWLSDSISEEDIMRLKKIRSVCILEED